MGNSSQKQKPIIEIRNLEFGFDEKSKGRSKIPGLSLPYLSISPGRIHALVGGSGCGKSLLLSLLSTFPPKTWVKPRHPEILSFSWFGEKFSEHDFGFAGKYSSKMRSALNKSQGNIWYVPQHLPISRADSVSVEKTLFEIVRATNPNKSPKEVCNAAETFFDKLNKKSGSRFFDWDKERHEPVRKLSGGERKRFEVCARLIALELFNQDGKALFLLDEPTAGLDPVRSRYFFEFIKNISKEDKDVAFVIATHDLQFLDDYADEIISIRRDDEDDETTTHLKEDKTCCEIFCGNVGDYKKVFGGESGNTKTILEIFERNNRRENGKNAESAGALQKRWERQMPEIFSCQQ
ncbi:MAG: AAA family ATPase [Opitutales bacterium]|nr:ATP-binding cassette domain-containing protein [Verrucomicrobiota bacterium]MBQ6704716.1 AAA family ATPase [Opitutales bacterium]